MLERTFSYTLGNMWLNVMSNSIKKFYFIKCTLEKENVREDCYMKQRIAGSGGV